MYICKFLNHRNFRISAFNDFTNFQKKKEREFVFVDKLRSECVSFLLSLLVFVNYNFLINRRKNLTNFKLKEDSDCESKTLVPKILLRKLRNSFQTFYDISTK